MGRVTGDATATRGGGMSRGGTPLRRAESGWVVADRAEPTGDSLATGGHAELRGRDGDGAESG
jgi:hypothetical protein